MMWNPRMSFLTRITIRKNLQWVLNAIVWLKIVQSGSRSVSRVLLHSLASFIWIETRREKDEEKGNSPAKQKANDSLSSSPPSGVVCSSLQFWLDAHMRRNKQKVKGLSRFFGRVTSCFPSCFQVFYGNFPPLPSSSIIWDGTQKVNFWRLFYYFFIIFQQ